MKTARRSEGPAWLAEIPDALLSDFVVVNRGLYDNSKPGVIICLFRNHKSPKPRGTTLPAGFPFPGFDDKVPRMYVITYILQGTGEVSHHGRRFQCRPGDFFQLNGDAIREYRVHSIDGLVECAICIDRFTGDVLAEQRIWDTRVECGHIGCQPTIVHRYFDLLNALRNVSLDGGTLLRRLAITLDDVYSLNETTSPDMQFLRKAKQILAQHCGPQDSINTIVSHFHVSYSGFARKFRSLAGISPRDFKLGIRMERACELLMKHSVKEAASELGYTDPFTFSRQFKLYFRVAPSAFKADFNSGSHSSAHSRRSNDTALSSKL